jgi:ribosomal protein L11 methyltransferase
MATSSDPFAHRPRRTWRAVTVEVPAALADAAADCVAECSGLGVAITALPAADGGERERIVGYLPEGAEAAAQEASLRAALAALAERAPGAGPVLVRSEMLVEEDWGSTWKEHFRPFHATARLVIRPSWEEYRAAAGEVVVEMDPGMAFGTGLHASTRLALAALEEHLDSGPPPARALDLGTGTGILGMACALRGVPEVVATDTDPDAVAAARENVARNGLGGRVLVTGDELGALPGTFDLIVANITANVLVALAGELAARLRPGGRLVLSGILAGEQEAQVREAYERLGLRGGAARVEGEWAALSLRAEG